MIMIPEEKKINDTVTMILNGNSDSGNVSMVDEYCSYLANRAIEAVKTGNSELLANVFKALLELVQGE